MYKTFLVGLTGGAIAGLIFRLVYGKPQEKPTIDCTPQQQNLSVSDDEEVYKLALVINTELGMQPGKVLAQCSHAALGVYEKYSKFSENFRIWESKGKPIIIYKVGDSDALVSLWKTAKEKKFPTYIVQDAGHTQIAAGSLTVLAVGPDQADKVRIFLEHLALY